MNESMDHYKKDISLPDFMKKVYDFEDAKRSTKHSIRLKHPESGEDYVIYKNKNYQWRYWRPEISTHGGLSIIDLVLEHNPTFTLGHVRGFLDRYLGREDLYTSKSNYQPNIIDNNESYILKEINNLKPYENRSFLHNRGIKDWIIDHEYFNPIVYNKPYYSKKYGKTFENTAFLMSSFTHKFQAIALRNDGFKGVLGKRGNGICASANKEKNIDRLIICETMDDCMAHFQMNYNDLKDQSVRYLATQGTVTDPAFFNYTNPDHIDKQITSKQTELINKVIEKNNPKQIEVGFDNDLQGAFFSNIILGKLTLPQHHYDNGSVSSLLDNHRFTFHSEDKQNFFITYKSVDYSDNDPIKAIQDLNNNRYDGLFTIDKVNNQDHLYKITLPDYTHLEGQSIHEQLNNFFMDIKFGPENSVVSRIQPLTKDFGDDLMAYKGLNNEHLIQQFKHPRGVTFYQFLNGLTDSQIKSLTGSNEDIETYSVSKGKTKGTYNLKVNENTFTKTNREIYSFAKENDLILSNPPSDFEQKTQKLGMK